MEEFENNSFKKKISLNKEKINNFKKSLCEEYASNSNEFPNLLIPSMSSKVITKSIKKYIKEETMPVYLKHKINFYNCKRDILNNFYINLKDHKVLRGDSIHKFKLSGSNCRSKLFDVELLLGIVNDNKLKNQE